MWFIIFGFIFFIESIILTVYGVKKKEGDADLFRRRFRNHDTRNGAVKINRPLSMKRPPFTYICKKALHL